MSRRPFDVTAGDVTLAADCWSGPDPAVVFLHSGVTDRRSWYAVCDRLEGTRRLVAYDRRGYGKSVAAPTDGCPLEDLMAVLDAVGPEPVILVGNSAGGGLALDAAIVRPERVTALLLLAPAVSGAPEPGPDDIDAATMVLDERLERAYADEDRDEAARLQIWLWLDGPRSAEGRVTGLPRSLAREMMLRTMALGADESVGGAGVDAWSRLADVGVPTLVGCGEYDVPLILQRSRVLAERLPAGQFRLLPGTAHLPSVDAPDTVAALVTELGP